MSFADSLKAFSARVVELGTGVEHAAIDAAQGAASRVASEYAIARGNVLAAQGLLKLAAAQTEDKAIQFAKNAFELLGRTEQRLNAGVQAAGAQVVQGVKDAFAAVREAAVTVIKATGEAGGAVVRGAIVAQLGVLAFGGALAFVALKYLGAKQSSGVPRTA